MVLQWVAWSSLAAEKSLRCIQGYRGLWIRKSKLKSDITLKAKMKAASYLRRMSRRSLPTLFGLALSLKKQYYSVQEA
jgi:hypothetical protein